MKIKSSILSQLSDLEHGFVLEPDLPPKDGLVCNQVHGTTILDLKEPFSMDSQPSADGLITTQPIAVYVLSADCLPVLFSDRSGSIVAAVHAGWKGFLAGMLDVAIETFKKRGVQPKDLLAAIGPAIGPCCFEIDSSLSDQFEQKFSSVIEKNKVEVSFFEQPRSIRSTTLPRAKPSGGDKKWLDLQTLGKLVLESHSLNEVELLNYCTYCSIKDGNRFESYRRSTHLGQKTGRLRSFIEIRR
ncbi:MAG: peptidoglycan editing factor PgeF [Bacteriovoracia bacterium]